MYIEESEGKKASVEKLLVQQVSKQESRQVSTYRMYMPESELGTAEDRASGEVLPSIPQKLFLCETSFAIYFWLKINWVRGTSQKSVLLHWMAIRRVYTK